jgi:aspartyl-tRNA(Asn)/glutamyl-tRNA(Gln) amidotransferase subunit B
MEKYIIKGEKSNWEIVIGLEVHCQILSQSKLFSSSSAIYGGEPNSQVTFLDAGLPGILPHLNSFCVEQAVKTGLALNGQINNTSYFDRKSYFYPDLPTGYQITQFYKPIMEKGFLEIELQNGFKKIPINRLHIEQDAGKLLHDHHPNKSFIDLNRAGVGLMEIVSEPEMFSKEEVTSYVTTLRNLVRYLGTCDGNMEEGSMRCDINISVRKEGETGLRTRTEVKNVNSIKFIIEAIDFEAREHIKTWEKGLEVKQETKLFNSTTSQTYSLRKKEESGGYRYFRDPDLLPLKIDDSYINSIKLSIKELPTQKKQRYITSYGLSKDDADILSNNKQYADFFEEAIKYNNNPKITSAWIITNLFAMLNKDNLKITESKVSAKQIGLIVSLIEQNIISGKIAKEILEIIYENQDIRDPALIVAEKGLTQITDSNQIEKIIDDVISQNKDKVAEIIAGKDRLLPWFVGQVMKLSKGKANPDLVNKLLNTKIYK